MVPGAYLAGSCTFRLLRIVPSQICVLPSQIVASRRCARLSALNDNSNSSDEGAQQEDSVAGSLSSSPIRDPQQRTWLAKQEAQRQQRGKHHAEMLTNPTSAGGLSLSELVELPTVELLHFHDSAFTLRQHQNDAILSVVEHWKQGCSGQLVMLPTGAGKTVIFATLARYLDQQLQAAHAAGVADASLPHRLRVLVLAHRHELLSQAEKKFELVWGPGIDISWVKGQRKEFAGQVVLASVQTAVNCLDELAARHFDLVIVDEAHHSVASSYKNVLEALGFITPQRVAAHLQQQPAAASGATSSSSQQDAASEAAGEPSSPAPLSVTSTFEEAGSSNGSSIDGGDSSSSSDDADDDDPASVFTVSGYTRVSHASRVLIGFTATPYRHKAYQSKELYEIVMPVFNRTIYDMIKADMLCRVSSRRVLTQVDLRDVKSSSGDFILSRLSPVVNHPSRNRLVLAAFLAYCTRPLGEGLSSDDILCQQLAAASSSSSAAAAAAARGRSRSGSLLGEAGGGGESSAEVPAGSAGDEVDDDGFGELTAAGRVVVRKAVGFAVDIAHAKALTKLFVEAGVRCSVVHSKLPWEVQRKRLHDFRHDKLDVLFNCEQLTEGFDEPSVSAILMARPTKSKGLYTQMLGRGLRLYPNKQDCLVLDFTDKTHKLTQVVDLRVLLPEGTFANLDPQQPPPEKGPRKLDLSDVSGGAMDLLEGDLHFQDLPWIRLGPHWVVSLFDQGYLWVLNMAEMGPQQRSALGIITSLGQQQQQQQQQEEQEAGQEQQQQQEHQEEQEQEAGQGQEQEEAASAAGSDDVDVDELDMTSEDRFVVLHQAGAWSVDPLTWHNVAPSAVRGMTESDAYGAACDFLMGLMRHQALQAVDSARRRGWKSNRAPLKLNIVCKSAPWRDQPASVKQLDMLRGKGVHIPPQLSKGDASDLITVAVKLAQATEQQMTLLQRLLNEAQLADLPVPLLKDRAQELIAAAAVATSSRSTTTSSSSSNSSVGNSSSSSRDSSSSSSNSSSSGNSCGSSSGNTDSSQDHNSHVSKTSSRGRRRRRHTTHISSSDDGCGAITTHSRGDGGGNSSSSGSSRRRRASSRSRVNSSSSSSSSSDTFAFIAYPKLRHLAAKSKPAADGGSSS